ncbi:MAG: magnesium and cobalt transport protein CorA [Xanthomonadales bacterium]|nr:magnesium and cobalt transport protein CorA [Xanthomonadales bacterium]
MSEPARGLVNAFVYDRRDGSRQAVGLEDIPAALADPERFAWLGLFEPDEAQIGRLREVFGLHELALEDALKAHQRPKVERYGEILFVVLRTVQFVDGEPAFGETHLFVGRNFLVSVRHGASLSYSAVRARCEGQPRMMRFGPAFALYAICDFVVDQYLPVAERCEEELGRLEESIFQQAYTRATVERLYTLKKRLVELRLALSPMQDLLAQLVRGFPELVPGAIQPYFRDVLDHAQRAAASIDGVSDLLSSALQVKLALVAVGQNEVVKKLAGWAALVAVPTLVASWYGMNFEHMPEFPHPWAYPILIAVVAAIVIALYVVLRRARWI